jgi:SurA N-terminal domain
MARVVPAVFALLLLSACGGRLGSPAAVVSGHRISQEALKSELDDIVLDPQVARQFQGPDGERNRKEITRRVLTLLIEVRLLEEYAAAHRFSVSRADVDQALDRTITSVGGRAAFDQELKARRLTLETVQRNLQREVLFEKVRDDLAARAGLPANAPDDQKVQTFQRWLVGRFRSGDVEVNPRFGRLDPRTGQILAITSTAS